MTLRAGLDWIEIPVTEIERAAEFYGKLFETTLEVRDEVPGIRSAFLQLENRSTSSPVVALMEGKPFTPSGYQGCRLYFRAEPSLEAFLARVEEAGGAIEISPLEFESQSKRTLLAMFFDTEGNLLGAHATK